MRPGRKIRFASLYVFFAVVFGAVLARLLWVQIVHHDFYAEVAFEQQYGRSHLPAARGVIYARDMSPLAMSRPVYDIYCIPRLVQDDRAVARMLAPVIEIEEAEIERRCGSAADSEWLAREVPRPVATKVLALGLQGIFARPSERRIYPEGKLACHVLGYLGPRDGSRAGAESTLDVYLEGLPGFFDGGADAAGRTLPDLTDNFVPPMNGLGCVLTIDKWCQYVSERELAATCERYDAESGAALVMDPRSGEILAMASYPTYDPNGYGDYRPECWRNNAVTCSLEPGSIVKPFLVAAALEEGVVSTRDIFDCSKTVKMGRYSITDVKPCAEPLTLAQVIERSSNIGVVHISRKLGGRRYYEYLRKFGFGERTDVELPAENPGIVRAAEFNRPLGRAFASFGQGFSATPLQITTAACALANGGTLVKPLLVSAIVDENGRTVRRFEPEVQRRVVSPEHAADVLRMMELVVERGGGKLARLPGYRVAGKTGTSEIADPRGRGYVPGAYHSSFLGIFPADAPRVVIFVTIRKPKSDFFGGVVAAPAAARIAADVLPALDVPPAGGRESVLPPPPIRRVGSVTFRDVPAATAIKRLSSEGLRARLDGRGSRVLWSSADNGPLPEKGSVVLIKLAAGERVMPDVVGLSVREAMRRLGPLGVATSFTGTGGWVAAQSPAAGTELAGKCNLTLAADAPARVRLVTGPGEDIPPAAKTTIAG
ncbi:MAG TPA: penicillin-binding protein [bacterium]|nr:penicillin-binding protein [bacterium]